MKDKLISYAQRMRTEWEYTVMGAMVAFSLVMLIIAGFTLQKWWNPEPDSHHPFPPFHELFGSNAFSYLGRGIVRIHIQRDHAFFTQIPPGWSPPAGPTVTITRPTTVPKDDVIITAAIIPPVVDKVKVIPAKVDPPPVKPPPKQGDDDDGVIAQPHAAPQGQQSLQYNGIMKMQDGTPLALIAYKNSMPVTPEEESRSFFQSAGNTIKNHTIISFTRDEIVIKGPDGEEIHLKRGDRIELND